MGCMRTNVKVFLAIMYLFTYPQNTWSLLDKRLCGDPKCLSIISLGKTVLKYTPDGNRKIAFERNQEVKIVSKNGGKDGSLWGIEIDGRKGYAPKTHIKEEKINIKNADLIEVPETWSENVLPVSKEVKTDPISIIAKQTQKSTFQAHNEATAIDPHRIDNNTDKEHYPSQHKIELNEVIDKDLNHTQEAKDSNNANLNSLQQLNPNLLSKEHSSNKQENVDAKVLTVNMNTQISEEKIRNINKNITELFESSKDRNNPESTENKDKSKNVTTKLNFNAFNTSDAIANNNLNNNSIQSHEEPSESRHHLIRKSESQANEKGETVVEGETVVNDNSANISHAIRSDFSSQSKNFVASKNSVDITNNTKEIKFPKSINYDNNTNNVKESSIVNASANENHNHNLNENFVDNVDSSIIKNEELHSSIPEDKAIVAENVTYAKAGADAFKPSLLTNEEIHSVDTSNKNADKTEIEVLNNSTNEAPSVAKIGELLSSQVENNSSVAEDVTYAQAEADAFKSSHLTKKETHNVNTSNNKAGNAGLEALNNSTNEDPTLLKIEELQSSQLKDKSTAAEDVTYSKAEVDAFKSSSLVHNEIYNAKNNSTNEAPNVEENEEAQSSKPGDKLNEAEKIANAKAEVGTFQPSNIITNVIDNTNISHENVDNVDDKGLDISSKQKFVSTAINLDDSEYINDHESYSMQDSSNNLVETKDEEIPLQSQTLINKDTKNIYNEESKFEYESNVHDRELDFFESEMAEKFLTPNFKTQDVSSMATESGSLFDTILETVNSFLVKDKPETSIEEVSTENDLASILYPDRKSKLNVVADKFGSERYQSNNCCNENSLDYSTELFVLKVMQNSQLAICLIISAASSLALLFGYYCCCSHRKDISLLSKLNLVERSLLAMHKENAILKHDLYSAKSKLLSIENNTFGSNDMVASIKADLELELIEKTKLQEQIYTLEKELEIAAEAGLELNKLVSELIANRNGDKTIINSVEELQNQLNLQEKTILEINSNLAEKSRENTELQITIAEQNARLTAKISKLQRDNDELELEKGNLYTKIEEMKAEYEQNAKNTLEAKNNELYHLQSQVANLNSKLEAAHSELDTCLAKIEAFEISLRTMGKEGLNVESLIDATKVRGELLDIQKKHLNLKTKYKNAYDNNTSLENKLKLITDELEIFKKDFHQAEKDKLEAQTRLEVLSTYFQEKEASLQKQLSMKEAIWLKQQGENTTTVDRLTNMQEELQTLKSQNDALRAEIDAQAASHKAQMGTVEKRAHESWLEAHQLERRFNEVRAEAASLRKKLTALAGGGDEMTNAGNVLASGNDSQNSLDIKNIPSPIPLELSNIPPGSLPFLPPPAFVGTHFMNLPPPPLFLPQPSDMRPAPLGRMKSPAPLSGRFSPYQDNEYSDYDDYDEEEYEEYADRRNVRKSSGRNWNREAYSPPPRTYRSLSPSESRYKYDDTETDYSPPRTPQSKRSYRRGYSPSPSTSPRHERKNRTIKEV